MTARQFRAVYICALALRYLAPLRARGLALGESRVVHVMRLEDYINSEG